MKIMADLARCAPAFVHVWVIAAGTGVHGCHQYKPGGKHISPTGPGKLNLLVLKGLAQYLQASSCKLRHFVQEQHAPLTGSSCLSQIVFEPTHFRYFGCPPYIYSRIPGDTKRGGVHPTTTKPPDCICYSGGS